MLKRILESEQAGEKVYSVGNNDTDHGHCFFKMKNIER